MSMGEVSLTFDNESHWLPIEFSEVCISRRIFRSGEGQYSINKSRVRLKDVVELFLDTGIGRDSYAIFEQGKIDRLLSESAIERRSLFEDFAGISKFKFRKEEAEKKLENSRLNIERVNDVLIELEKEVASLKEQSDNASKYNDFRSELRQLELKFEALRVHNFENEIMNKYSQKKNTEDRLKPLLEEIKKKEKDLILAEEEIQIKETEFNAIRDDYTKAEREYGEIKSRLENNKERKTILINQIKNMESRLVEGGEREKTLKGELQQKMDEMDLVTGDKEAVYDEMSEIQNKIDVIHKEIKNLDSEILKKSKELGFEKIISKDDIDKQKHELVAYQTRLENYRASLEEKWENRKNIQSELKEKNDQLEIALKDKNHLKTELENVISDIEGLHKKESELKQMNNLNGDEIKSLQYKLKSMDKIIMDSLEKQSGMLKKFMDQKPLLESNIDNAINLITECIQENRPWEETRESIERLKNHFKDYKNYYENILGILYSDEGTYTHKENVQKSIEEFTDKIYQTEIEIETVRSKTRELQTLRESIQNNYNKNDFEIQNLETETGKISEQLSSVQESSKNLENQINAASETIKKKQILIENMMLAVEDYDENIRDLKADRNNLFDDLNKKKVEYARAEEKYKSLDNEIRRIKNQISDIEKMHNTYDTDIKNSAEVIAELDKRIVDDANNQKVINEKIREFQNDIENRKSMIEAIQKSRKVIDLQRKEIEENIIKMEKVLVNLENAISERKGFLESIVENAQKNYSMDIRKVEILKEDNFDTISAEINRFRMELQNLGDVNLLAIEQYQNAKERMDFLIAQKLDSEKAMADIEALIKETNAKCIEQFTAAFEDIRKAFKKIFARLFDGGKADLVLENEKDILNTGINIFAEPPGKKFQSISLLSGGERALVAIAVIFSILYLKPTPFVVLDEMDAPLDDDNIERFKAIVKDFKLSSQFIIVSHSKSTLEICDALYGVTMEELGVSKIINVAFDEAELLFKSDDNQVI